MHQAQNKAERPFLKVHHMTTIAYLANKSYWIQNDLSCTHTPHRHTISLLFFSPTHSVKLYHQLIRHSLCHPISAFRASTELHHTLHDWNHGLRPEPYQHIKVFDLCRVRTSVLFDLWSDSCERTKVTFFHFLCMRVHVQRLCDRTLILNVPV